MGAVRRVQLTDVRGHASFLLAAAALGAVITIAGCAAHSVSPTASATSKAPAVVPGGAGLSVRPGAPAFCAELVNSTPVRDISQSLSGLAETPPLPGAVGQLRAAASSLAVIGRDVPASLKGQFDAASSALDSVAANGVTDAAGADAASNALTQLGQGVQGECDFPLS
jgi:hypothetical protein